MSLDMNPEIRAQWCAALRSAQYQQAKDTIRASDGAKITGHCCLGVLADLYVKAGNPESYGDDQQIWDLETLAKPVQAWAGLNDGNPVLLSDAPDGGAAWLNDNGFTFAEIADLIDGGAS